MKRRPQSCDGENAVKPKLLVSGRLHSFQGLKLGFKLLIISNYRLVVSLSTYRCIFITAWRCWSSAWITTWHWSFGFRNFRLQILAIIFFFQNLQRYNDLYLLTCIPCSRFSLVCQTFWTLNFRVCHLSDNYLTKSRVQTLLYNRLPLRLSFHLRMFLYTLIHCNLTKSLELICIAFVFVQFSAFCPFHYVNSSTF